MTGSKTYASDSIAKTHQIAQTLAQALKSRDVVAFRGGMGAGKTTFIQGLAQALGVAGEVSSPTFALVHEYPGSPPLFHFDMYRIESIDDLYSTGFFDYLDTDGILVIEWSEKIDSFLPDHTIFVEITAPANHVETHRNITIFGKEETTPASS